MIERLPTWRADLNAHIEANRNRPFEWGQHDCGLWSASCRIVTHGDDVASDLRGRYKSAVGAVKSLRRAGFSGGPEDVAKARVGASRPAAFGKAGDMVAADLVELGLAGDERQIGLSLGICNGPVCYFVGENGLIEIPLLQMKCSFDG